MNSISKCKITKCFYKITPCCKSTAGRFKNTIVCYESHIFEQSIRIILPYLVFFSSLHNVGLSLIHNESYGKQSEKQESNNKIENKDCHRQQSLYLENVPRLGLIVNCLLAAIPWLNSCIVVLFISYSHAVDISFVRRLLAVKCIYACYQM